MTFSWKEFGSLFKGAYKEWSDDNASRLGAALAYYTVFSLAPLLLIVIAVAGFVWGGQSGGAQAQVVAEMRALLGPDGAALVESMLDNMSRPGSGSVLATVVGVAVLVFGATTVFAQLQGALNTIWDVKPSPESGYWPLVTSRLLSFGMILTIGFLLLVSLVISAVISAMEGQLTQLIPGAQWLVRAANLLVSLGIVTLLFAMIYRYLPDVEIAWRDVWTGAFITAVLFTLGKWALGTYLANSSVGPTYGAAGSLVVLLLWVYYSAQTVFFGADLTQVYIHRYGAQVRPAAHAVWADPEAARAYAAEDGEHVASPAPARAPTPARAAGAARAAARRPLWRRALPVVAAFFAGRFLGKR